MYSEGSASVRQISRPVLSRNTTAPSPIWASATNFRDARIRSSVEARSLLLILRGEASVSTDLRAALTAALSAARAASFAKPDFLSKLHNVLAAVRAATAAPSSAKAADPAPSATAMTTTPSDGLRMHEKS